MLHDKEEIAPSAVGIVPLTSDTSGRYLEWLDSDIEDHLMFGGHVFTKAAAGLDRAGGKLRPRLGLGPWFESA